MPQEEQEAQGGMRSPSYDSLFAKDATFGLEWVHAGLFVNPAWTIEPTIESIKATLGIAIGNHQDYRVRLPYIGGAYTRLYEVYFNDKAYVMRVSLPVCPRAKTESEVATLEWVHQHTCLPVPRVVAYDSSRDNPLGFEWILMTKIDGKPLAECWWSVSLAAKERIVKQIAAFSAAAFQYQPSHEGIGSIYKAVPDSDGPTRGPFSDSSDWVTARLRHASADLTSRLPGIADEQERRLAGRMIDLISGLERLKGTFFPDCNKEDKSDTNAEKRPVRTILCHDNLSLDNILVDENGVLMGVIDWQCIPCLPVHDSCQFPSFLQQMHDRFQEPTGHLYVIDAGEPPHPAYFRDLRRFEMTKLRRLYIEEMLDLDSEFVVTWRRDANADLRDYEAAVQNCDNEFIADLLEEWVNVLEEWGTPSQMPKRLHELLQGG
ncbi:phosphotransferase enzyme family-domain-containing protein [Poronia punctata]|nr:phosphotransferase enzyme family-domain-containing protein [Poronia punctata]